jgi:tetratricopeptide (TPR) repeat protein
VPDRDRELARARALLDDTFVGIDVLREAATGGMGLVFEGIELSTGRRVAVKLLAEGHASNMARFAAEAEILERLATDTIVAYVAHGVTREGEPYLIMDWLEGETLAALLARRGRALELGDVLTIARRIAAALACAHEHGIVHRDVKPSNVFLPGGIPGQAKLIDFGIARHFGRDDRNLTTTGQLVGTPGYMAPEQALGRRDLDGRVDLFALGCLMYEMIHGEPPFAGVEVVEVLARVLMQEPQPPATDGPAVPPRIGSLVTALLAKEPQDRVATASLVEAELAEIADALERGDQVALRREPYRRVTPPRRLRRSIVVVGALVAIASGAVIWKLRDGGSETVPKRCDGGEAAFASAWNAERRQSLRDALAKAKTPSAPLEAELDRYGATWSLQHADACRATRIRGDQTEAMLDLRMVCLERRRQAVVALLDVVSTAAPATAARASSAAKGLPPVADCADVATLKLVEPPPADPAVRKQLDELAARLATARVRYQTGGYEAALAETRPINVAAQKLGYRPFEADAGLLQGQLEHRLNQLDAAIATVQSAVWAAEAGRNDEVAARGWVLLVFLVGYERRDHARAQELAQRTSAAIARLGGNADIEASLEQSLGAIAATQGRLEESIRHFRNAIPLLERQFGPEHPNVAGARENLATALLEQGDAHAAVELMRQVLAVREKTLVAGHQLIGRALQNLGTARDQIGEHARAEADLRRALAISTASLTPEHPEIAEIHTMLARVLSHGDKPEDALAIGRTGIALAEAAYGSASAELATHRLSFAGVLGDAGKLGDADAMLARAETTFAKLDARGDLARTWVARGDLQLRRARWREAIALYERALPILETTEASDEPRIRAQAHLGIAYLRTNRAKPALAVLERPHATAHVSPGLRATHDFALAQALWAGGGDRVRARELADRAIAGFSASPKQLAEAKAWRARHR